MQQYGETIYGTRGNFIPPQPWGVITSKNKTLFVHILQPTGVQDYIFIPGLQEKVLKAANFADKSIIKFKQQPEGLFIYLKGVSLNDTDTVISLELK